MNIEAASGLDLSMREGRRAPRRRAIYRLVTRAGLLTMAILAVARLAHASPLIQCSVEGSLDQYTYHYVIMNDAASPVVGFELSPIQDIAAVAVPSDSWTYIQFGDTLQFIAFDEGVNVPAGSSLSGFSFKSINGPGEVRYFGITDPSTDVNGTTIGPSASVPEPSNGVLLVLGGVFAIAYGFTVRRRTRRVMGQM